MPEPGDSLTEVLGVVADRVSRYAEIWQGAARANAQRTYSTDDALSDMQATFSLMVRDWAEASEAMLKALSSYAQDAPASSPAKAAAKKATVKKTAMKKKAVAKKAPAKKASTRKPK